MTAAGRNLGMLRAVASRLVSLTAAALLAACASLSAEERQLVLAYLENAAQYYDTGHYLRAYQQWGKALDLDSDEDRARLGQAMALYQLGREESTVGVGHLAEAETRLDALRRGGLADQDWKAELGFALVQERWAELYERAANAVADGAADGGDAAAKAADARAELPRRIASAERSFRKVLDDPRTEPNFKLTCWLGLARVTSMRGAYEESLTWCVEYDGQVRRSVEFWEKQGDTYAGKLFGAKLQEAELRDVLGNTLFKLGRFEEAERELDRLVALQPTRANAYLNRGIVRETRGAWDLARADFGSFLQWTDLPPESPAVLEAQKRRLLCEERLAAQDASLDGGAASPR